MAYQPDDGISDLMESYEPAPSAWHLLKEHISESEIPEIRGVLGGGLVDLCIDTYSEVEMWVKIWKDVCHKQGSGPKPSRTPLADSPVVKELMKAEIRLLLLSLQEKAAKEGKDEEAAISSYSPSVVKYALSSGRPARAQSAGSRFDRQEVSSRPQSAKSLQEVRSASRLSAGSGSEDNFEALKHKLNVTHIEEVVAHLKSVLNEDLQAMKREIQFLQECVEQMHQSPHHNLAQEPTVSELKEERKLIQNDLKPESTQCPVPTGSLQESTRPAGQVGVLPACGIVHSVIFPKDTPPYTRPHRLPGHLSLPPVAPVRPPAHVLSSSCRTQEPSLHHGNELSSWRHSNINEPVSVPEKCTIHRGTCTLSVISGKDRSLRDSRDSSRTDARDSRPMAGFHTQEEKARPSSPTCIMQPCPPAQRKTHDKDMVTGPPISKLIPTPPAAQKPTSRGQSVTRRLQLPHGGLVSPT